MPDLVKRCTETQHIPGYEHIVITLENCYRGSPYVNECLEAGNWVKASDWIRLWNLWSDGGIYVDGDMSIMPGKNFDALLHHRLFLSKEAGGYWANAALGAEPRHPVLRRYLDRVENNYRGSGDDIFSPGIRCFTDIFWEAINGKEDLGIFECPVEYFFPYNHLNKQVNVTAETIVYHHYMTSWGVPKDQPVRKAQELRLFCSYHLGDQIFTLWFMNAAAKLFPNIRFSLWVEPRYFAEVKALARPLPNLEVTATYANHTQLEWWLGDWCLYRRNPDRPNFVESMIKLQALLASRYDLPHWVIQDKLEMLLPGECMDPNHALKDQSFDVLFVNSEPMSGQCVGHNHQRMNELALELFASGLKVVTTHPCGLSRIPNTTGLGMTLAQIGELAFRCRVVAGVCNAPFLATFNELAFSNVERWVNYGTDKVDFDAQRVVWAKDMIEFERALDLCRRML